MEKLSETLGKRKAEIKEKSAQTDTPTWSCKQCKDTGTTGGQVYYNIYGTHEGFCNCEIGRKARSEWINLPEQKEIFRKWKMERVGKLLEKSKVGPKFSEKRLSDLKDSPKLFELCENYVTNFNEYKKKGWGLYLWGNLGSGKTHTATAVCNELIEKHLIEVLFVNLSDAAERVKSTFDDTKNSDSDLFEEMKKAELLVIDDIGVEKVTEWLSEQLYLIINHRYENNLPIIATSNQSLEDLGLLHKPQIASRLDEMCKSVKFAGKDRRKDKRPAF